MCGLTGIVSNLSDWDEGALNRMTKSLSHRGPDDFGTLIYSTNNTRVGLGHTRLSILDLSSKGHQPKESFDKRYSIVHNGEIYNFKEIQKELIHKGYQFSSETDTEVILNSYAEWGEECVNKFLGMFVFAILDKEKKTLKIFRDRAGVKPLYYYYKEGLFCFGSELKSLMEYPGFERHLSMSSLSLFFRYGYVPSPYCIFENTYKLEPGHILKINLISRELTKKSYWNVTDFYNLPKLDISEEEAIHQTEKILSSACKYRLVSDVPVGVFLSGGYDSTAVSALLQMQSSQKLKTFTIGFQDPKYDEAPHAREIASILGTDHTEYYCDDQDALDIIPLLPKIYDEPFADSSAIPTTLVSRLAREHVTVSLSADGGDEIFGGYTKYSRRIDLLLRLYHFRHVLKYPMILINNLLNQNKYQRKLDLINVSVFSDNLKSIARKRVESNYINTDLQDTLYRQNIPDNLVTTFDEVSLVDQNYNDILDIMMCIDYKTYMTDDVLHKVDRASMSTGLEGREPLLDHRLIEFLAQLPSDFKIKNGSKKYLLKKIVHKHVPKKIMDRPKTGFGIPFDKWFSNDRNELFNHFLSDGIVKKHGLLDHKVIQGMKKEYSQRSNPLIRNQLWILFIFNQWFDEWNY